MNNVAFQAHCIKLDGRVHWYTKDLVVDISFPVISIKTGLEKTKRKIVKNDMK